MPNFSQALPEAKRRTSLKEAIQKELDYLKQLAHLNGLSIQERSVQEPWGLGQVLEVVEKGDAADLHSAFYVEPEGLSKFRELAPPRDIYSEDQDTPVYYRIEASTSYQEDGTFGTDLTILTGVQVKKTPCGAWVQFSITGKPRFIFDNSTRSYAYPTREAALNSFLKRSASHLGHLKNQKLAAAMHRSLAKSEEFKAFIEGRDKGSEEHQVQPGTFFFV